MINDFVGTLLCLRGGGADAVVTAVNGNIATVLWLQHPSARPEYIPLSAVKDYLYTSVFSSEDV